MGASYWLSDVLRETMLSRQVVMPEERTRQRSGSGSDGSEGAVHGRMA